MLYILDCSCTRICTYTSHNLFPHCFHIPLEGQHVVGILTQRPAVVQHIAQHPEGVYVALLAARLGEDVLRSKVVEGGVGVDVSTTVPFPKLECGLERLKRKYSPFLTL